MHVHILGIGGTFMAGVALLARAAGHRVTGSDAGLYPPMSTQLADAGIEVMDGYAAAHLDPAPDQVVIGNAMTRGNPAVEHTLDAGLAYTSGPQWLAENVLRGRWVLAVAGTHGKTTTASMLAHILQHAGLAPGFLIGGIAPDLGRSAAMGSSDFFVVEADEYDTAFFDKRAKFVHYRPRTLVLNNLEFDHADIFDDLEAIKRQFHHLVRTVPAGGQIVHNAAEPALDDVLARGCWTPTVAFNGDAGWQAEAMTAAGDRLRIRLDGADVGELAWSLGGAHNRDNALAALAAARHVGVAPEVGIEALSAFGGVRRRLELRGTPGGIAVYDDFAHHPTAIRTTLDGLRAGARDGRILVVFEPRSNTMRRGVHADTLAASFERADAVYVYAADIDWDADAVFAGLGDRVTLADDIDHLVAAVVAAAAPGDTVVVMSNGGFGGIHERLLDAL
ncbi:UDP-N-acetylmuramate:L-alanyl-gamma-D-glutamyl-meso-diaminopimelate ligase [Salinisphaera orenii]|uniref:UDP-N-acetylmuramate--L-alanyl-gamma-D-glutamyl-meso-2,6-diaminoheptandioate ligase n=1 Tax=Salinisphaera orenii YIM 95161 TaxID=1051139 RepID=A0A423QAT3_9GAMM|nr:UDP-N-acetylmuramate:L-alanyl-gamma-D-glutamyl-meso-diaminopimelate ligase [Salinisphaera halophila]ROO37696.1 UDP-N-acetylmuramate:L-alanyl-gamma-D-glutamyl-meso-diaminopimelate ligase [Salinisphaera halophila YIM 95161]